ncbi:ABC transporter permease [Aquincola sp. S2]|uniref:ABC transporter permease n=1 Tax=Pseudaquabacterium terrae TaxID=2732868 RepID=A0ABX2EQY7_9BURK|nr:FtsX-like permease family protein [Aquabacterium terrae]NRF71130.1 ABC transporter permease [Aquabacterium terrae]
MKALDRKLWRDLRLLWSQALTIALVVAAGIAGFVTSLSAVDSLAAARDDYYAAGRFADVFAALKRAPGALEDALRELPGVADVQTGLDAMVRVTIPGVPDPVIGQLIGLDLRQAQRLNVVAVASGRPLQADDDSAGAQRIPVLVSRGFALARGLKPGDELQAQINGRLRTLRISGIALSPEFVFAGLWGMPDMRGYGVFWLDRRVLAAAYDMQGAFNKVAVRLAPAADAQAAIDALAHRLAPYGGRDVQGRAQQPSHQMLDNEIKQQRVIGTVLPAIFLGVAAFLLHVVISRLVGTQREQIAALKALGYADLAIGAHYLKLVLLIVAVGLGLGLLLGSRLGAMFTGLYAELFQFPRFEHRLAPWLVATSAAVALMTAVLGTLHAVLATVRLPPAEAMRPPAPGRYRRTLLEQLGIRRMAPALRMIVRNMERRPLRTAMGIGGIAAAVAITIMGNFFRDAIDTIVHTQFELGLRGDVTVWTAEPVDDAARLELMRLPGVRAVESTRFVPVTLIHRHRRERSMIRAYAARPDLYRVIDVAGQATLLDGGALVLTDRLADKLGLRVGDAVQADVLVGAPRTLALTVGGTVREMMGLNAYMERGALNRALGEGDVATGWVLGLEPGKEGALLEATQALPRSAGAFSKATMLRNMQEISARNVRIMSTMLTAFAAVISVGVVYNNARIALAERGWELASLRVLGFSRAEVSALLLGELALAILIALPLGMAAGWALVNGVNELLRSDQFMFPATIRARTYAWAALCVLAAGIASALVVRRRIDRLDLVAVLKTRE